MMGWSGGSCKACPTRRTSEHEIKARSIKNNFPWSFMLNRRYCSINGSDCCTYLIHAPSPREDELQSGDVCHRRRWQQRRGAATFTSGSSRHCFQNDSHSWGLKIASSARNLSLLSLHRHPPQHSLLLFFHLISSLVSSAFLRAFFFFSHTNTPKLVS